MLGVGSPGEKGYGQKIRLQADSHQKCHALKKGKNAERDPEKEPQKNSLTYRYRVEYICIYENNRKYI
jgi:hypothetical protein